MLKLRADIQSRKDAERVIGEALDVWLCKQKELPDALVPPDEDFPAKIFEALFEDALQNGLFVPSEEIYSKNCQVALHIVSKYVARWKWSFDEERDAEWFAGEVERNPDFAGVNLKLLLSQWSNFLEHESAERSEKRRNKFPRIWKNSLLNFLKRESRQMAEDKARSNGHSVRPVSFSEIQACEVVRSTARKSAMGRSETPEQFEVRVQRTCTRSGVRYVSPGERVGAR